MIGCTILREDGCWAIRIRCRGRLVREIWLYGTAEQARAEAWNAIERFSKGDP